MKKRLVTISVCVGLCVASFFTGMQVKTHQASRDAKEHYINGITTGQGISTISLFSYEELESLMSKASEIAKNGSLEEELEFLDYISETLMYYIDQHSEDLDSSVTSILNDF